MKHYLFIGFLFVFFSCCAQDIDRVMVAGAITAPIGEDVEGITIYNKSSQKGAITDADGLFQIEVAENDRVLITAMQYQTFTVIIDNGVVSHKVMNVYMNPEVNKLDEVIVRPYDLSGNIRADVGAIETNVISPAWDLSYETLEFEYEFAPDENSSIVGNRAEEAYYNGQKLYDGVSIIGIIGMFASKKTQIDLAREHREKAMVRGGLVQRFPKQFVLDTFGIDEDDYGLFLYFAEDAGISKNLLKEENAVELLDFLFAQRVAFIEEREKE